MNYISKQQYELRIVLTSLLPEPAHLKIVCGHGVHRKFLIFVFQFCFRKRTPL